VSVLLPRTLDDVLVALAEHPDAQLLAGGTDLMVAVNYGHIRPSSVIALRNVRELRFSRQVGDTFVIGAGVTYAELEMGDLADRYPALAAASRTVGSPQIRNAGTIGGNVANASPAGDTLPVLAALDATIELRSQSGTRLLDWQDFFLGVKRTARSADEVVYAIHLPVLDSRQDYLKVGTRNAMVISVAGVAIVVDRTTRTVRCGLGSVGPIPLRATAAEEFAAANITWGNDWAATTVADPRTFETFGAMVAAAAKPIDDHRSTADYRRHAIGVMARRALLRLLP
jgi:CO/xanthine dehydrogenase FAD-binding subunit